DFYRSFLDAEINEVSTVKVAESTKIVENAFRDINIAYVNELAKSFDAMGIDLIETLQGASNKPFSFMAHWPSRGVGGHCIAVDPYYLIKRAQESGFDHRFLKMAREVNNSMPEYTVSRLQEGLNEIEKSVKGSKIALLGLSYKSNVADLRESPSLEILDILKEMGAKVISYDPYIPDMSDVKSLEEVLDNVDGIILGTYHDKFGDLTEEILKRKNIKVVVDGVNKLGKDEIGNKKVIYRGIGR
ncbi:nucleotide sugar dehydrogenase, partial [Candidatus Dojkabacteria bacterium]|nr:nucleotide sugar dehydrogenase [Candidatus Dojkabacteria bacterium]